MFDKKAKIFIFLLIGVFLITSGLGCQGTPGKLAEKVKPINLVYWRMDDGQDAFSGILQGFKALYPHISITYQLIRPEEYEQALLEAWAEDRGPDIFSIPNTWLGKYQTKILPLAVPDTLTVAHQVTKGTIKKETTIVEETIKTPKLRDLQDNFVETVPKDVIIDNKLYGLPLSLDVLSLYYNRDMLNNAGIANPPQTWQEFINDVKLLTLQDRNGDFIQSAVPLGTAKNIANATDILSLLMLQNGTPIANEQGGAIFDQSARDVYCDEPPCYPGREALRFYTSFATPGNEVYTWDEKMPDAFEAFAQGKTAFLFGYSDYLLKFRQAAPKLNFDITKAPQISGSLKEVNYTRYFVETISKKTKYPNEAWAFVLYATTAQNTKTFLSVAKHPTCHRALIKDQLEDFDLAPFVKAVLTAQTWYRGKNYSLVDEAFKEMVENVLNKTKTIQEALTYCAQKVNLTY